MKKEGKIYNQHAKCTMHLEKQKYIYHIQKQCSLDLNYPGENILAARNAVGKVQIPRFSKGVYVTLLGIVMNSYLGALHACFRLLTPGV